jgi:hypothetical protein
MRLSTIYTGYPLFENNTFLIASEPLYSLERDLEPDSLHESHSNQLSLLEVSPYETSGGGGGYNRADKRQKQVAS